MKHNLWEKLLVEEEGMLTLEWIFLLTTLVIGIVAGTAVLRDSLQLRMFYTSNALGAVTPAYSINAYEGRTSNFTRDSSESRIVSNGSSYGIKDGKACTDVYAEVEADSGSTVEAD